MSSGTYWTVTFIVRMCFNMICLAIFANAVPQFQNGKYRNIIIVVNERIPETSKGISNDFIKELFKEASKLLFNATNRMASFGEIVIVVPEIWGIKDVQGEGNVFLPADIRIDKPNPEYREKPYTVQQGECGEPGKYIHLTPGFFKMAMKGKTRKLAARLLVHEWAHLRYGVFDENSLHQDESLFRVENGKILPPTCPGDIPGWVAKEGLKRCEMRCGKVVSGCNFYPDPKSISKKGASIMSHPHLENVDLFCNSSNHNEKAIFPHNRMCKDRSTYEVIMRHEDFKNKYRWGKNPRSEPKLIWKKGYKRNIVFVVDVSNSSKKINDTATVFYHPLARYVMARARSGSYIGVVTFSRTVNIITSQLVRIKDSPQHRDILARKLFNSLLLENKEKRGNATLGIEEGVRMLRSEGGMVILMSASESLHNLTNVEALINSNVVVNVIAFGKKTNVNLEDETSRTGGTFYFLNKSIEDHRWTDVDMAIISSLISVSNFSGEPVIVVYKRLQAFPSSVVYFLVDEWIGKNTIVTAAWRDGTDTLSLSLSSQSRKDAYNNNSREYRKENRYKEIKFQIPKIAENGTWKLGWGHGHRDMDVIVTSEPKDPSDPPIRLKAWIAKPKESVSDVYGTEHYRIFAELKKGYDAVVNANVIATFEFVGQGDIHKTLRDDGSPPDVRKNDGIYASYMPLAPRDEGRPVVIVRADNRDKNAKRRVGSRGSGASLRSGSKEFYEDLSKKFGSSKKKFNVSDFEVVKSCKKTGEMEEPGVTHYNLPDFDRVAIVGSPFLIRATEDDDKKAKPPPIRDLTVARTINKSNGFHVELQWTVPEDSRLAAKVSKIELRGSADREMLNSTNFENAHLFRMLEEMEIDPPGQMQALNVTLSADQVEESIESMGRYFFAMKTRDSLGNDGDTSNIAEALLDPEFEERDIGIDENEEDEDQSGGKKNIILWILLGIGGLLLISFLFLGLVLAARKRREIQQEKEQDYCTRAFSTLQNAWNSAVQYVGEMLSQR